MAMNYVTIKGYIRNGKLDVELPENVEDGEVEIKIPVPELDEEPLTDAEIEDMLRPEPKSGAEIVELGHTGGWEHKGIKDGVEWIEDQRRKRREKRGW
jgi:hypothetical protein